VAIEQEQEMRLTSGTISSVIGALALLIHHVITVTFDERMSLFLPVYSRQYHFKHIHYPKWYVSIWPDLVSLELVSDIEVTSPLTLSVLTTLHPCVLDIALYHDFK
jgi:hypothetical protein